MGTPAVDEREELVQIHWPRPWTEVAQVTGIWPSLDSPVKFEREEPRSPVTSVTLAGVPYKQGASAMAFKLRSPAFGPGGDIPVKHACDGSDVSPPLRWTDPPEDTKSFALTVDDLDSTSGLSVHWLLYGIPVTLRELHEGIPREDAVPGIGRQGLNDLDVVGYSGPCPLPGPAHRYAFTLYALDTLVSLLPRKSRADLRKAMYGHVVVRVKLIARYKRK